MTDAEAEIKATITVQTSESTEEKKVEKDIPVKMANGVRRGTIGAVRRDTLAAGESHDKLHSTRGLIGQG